MLCRVRISPALQRCVPFCRVRLFPLPHLLRPCAPRLQRRVAASAGAVQIP